MPTQSSPSFDDLPRHIVASFILPYVSSNDWLSFRVSSRGCYRTVHGSADHVSQFVCPKCRCPTTTSTIASSSNENNNNNILSENLWRLALVRDFLFEETPDDDINQNQDWMHQSFHSPFEPVSDALVSTQNMFTASNLFVSWMHWRKLYLRLDSPASCKQILSGPFFLRASSMWQKIEQWCNDKSRSKKLGRVIKSSLLPGRKVNEFLIGNTSEGWLAFQAVYAFYAGQCDSSSENFREYSGLFGAFQVYDTTLDTRWGRPEVCANSCIITVAETFAKSIFLDLSTGQLYCLFPENQLLVATPCAGGTFRQNSEHGGIRERPLHPTDGKDSILRWFEEHAHRLHHDWYSVGTLIHDERPPNRTIALLKYPTVSDTVHCSRAVTRGIEIIASAVYIQELNPGAMFVYSIRMRLLTPEDGDEYMSPEQRGFGMCQLVSRRWKICKHVLNRDEPLIEEVRGNGVIGYHPLLSEGGYVKYYSGGEGMVCLGDFPGCFTYQSCTGADASGTMEGYLQFIPGNMFSPTGAVFDVRVAPFPLQLPTYLY